MKHPNFDEAAHPRDEKGRWAEKAKAAIKAAGNTQVGKAVRHFYKAKADAAALTLGAYTTYKGAKQKAQGTFEVMQAKNMSGAIHGGLNVAGGSLRMHSGMNLMKQAVSNGSEKRGLSPKAKVSPPKTLGKKGTAKKTQMK